MTRTGKIARLPREIREELNHRLDDGEAAPTLIRWLHSLPAAQVVLKNEFNGRPINPQNLSEWRRGGYRDWLDHREARELAMHLAAETDKGSLNEQIATQLNAHLLVLFQRLSASDLDEATKFKRLRDIFSQLIKLRRGDHAEEWLRLRREQMVLAHKSALPDFDQLLCEWAERRELKAHLQRLNQGGGSNQIKPDQTHDFPAA